MNIAELFVRRHVLAYMVSAVLILFGLISIDRIGLGRFPDMDSPMVTVMTVNPGATPELMDASVTNIIESAVNGVPGIDYIESQSSTSVSVVALRFNLDKDSDVAFLETQAKVNQVLNDLPREAERPIVAKVEVSAIPVVWLVVKGERTLKELNQIALLNVKKKLEGIDGVGEVRIGGGQERTIRVDLNLARMSALGITNQDVIKAFQREHIKVPGGYLVGSQQEKLLYMDMEFHTIEGLQGLLVRHRQDASVHLADIADITDGLADKRNFARYNGEQAVGLGIVKVRNANSVAIVEQVMDKLETVIKPSLPDGVEILVAANEASIITEVVQALKEHIVEGVILAALVVLLFLANIRATLIIATAIPVSLLGAVIVLYFGGYNFNIMTLLGLLLLIGVVVDDAIVVLENIHRHQQENREDPVRAAVKGTEQVIFAVVASSLTLVCIFSTVIFMEGMIGRLLESFAVVVTVGVLTSLLVSLTLTPMLCSRYLVSRHAPGGLATAVENFHKSVENRYRKLLGYAVKHRWTVLALMFGFVSSTVYFMGNLGGEFFPEEDESRFIVIMKTPLGSSADYVSDKLDVVEGVIGQHPAVNHVFTVVGSKSNDQVNEASINVMLHAKKERDISQAQALEDIRVELKKIPGIDALVAPFPLIAGQRGEPLQFQIIGPDFNRVAEIAQQLYQQMIRDENIRSVDLDLQLDLPMLSFTIDRVRTAAQGLNSREVAEAVSVLAGGLDVAKFSEIPGDGERYDIRLQAKQDNMRSSEDLQKIYFHARDGSLIRLDAIADYKEEMGPATIQRYDLKYAAKFYSMTDISLGEAVGKIQSMAKPLLSPGYDLTMGGQADEFEKTQFYIVFVFVTGLILIYMVLASQFNSFLQPAIVMLAQPLAIVGGILALWIFNYTLNINSMIGLVLLIGLVSKNSILLVDLTNRFCAEGMDVDTALLTACPQRMRPVLMTSLTVILALFPAALGIGAGAEQYSSLAVAVIGGMISSTLLTLVVVPAAYSLIEELRGRGQRANEARV